VSITRASPIEDFTVIVGGIDPGVHGALAVLNEMGDCDTIAMPIMGAPKPIVDGGALARWFGDRDVEIAVIELAAAFRIPPKKGQKARGMGVTSTFNFGQAYGQVLGALQASLIPYVIVSPARWKGDMHLSRDKEQSRRRVIELLPRAAEQFARKMDENRAEAALLAWWYLHGRHPSERHGRILEKGQLV
jgi:crossover junction endodeoxyribonuclease RuvC